MASVDRKELERLRRLNPGVSDEELTEAILIRRGRERSSAPTQATEEGPGFFASLGKALLPGEEGLRARTKILDPFIPQSLPEAAGLGASLAAIPLTGGMSVPAALGTRVGLPAITAGLTGLATGEGFTGPAAVEGLGGLGGELVGATGRFLKRAGQGIITRVPLLKQGIDDAKSLFSSIVEEVPTFRKILDQFKGREQLVWLQDPKVGKQLLKDTFQETDDRIAAHFGSNRKFKVDKIEFDTKPDPTTRAKTGVVREVEMTIPEIQDLVKEYKQVIADFPEESPIHFSARQALGSLETTYKEILGTENLKWLRMYESAVDQYRKGLKVMRILKDSKALSPSESGVVVHNPQLAAFLLENIDQFGPSEIPKIWRSVGRGGPLGSSDVVFEAFRGARAITPRIAGGPAGAVTFPAISRRIAAGSPLPSPLFGTPGTIGASIPTILGQRAGSAINRFLEGTGF